MGGSSSGNNGRRSSRGAKTVVSKSSKRPQRLRVQLILEQTQAAGDVEHGTDPHVPSPKLPAGSRAVIAHFSAPALGRTTQTLGALLNRAIVLLRDTLHAVDAPSPLSSSCPGPLGRNTALPSGQQLSARIHRSVAPCRVWHAQALNEQCPYPIAGPMSAPRPVGMCCRTLCCGLCRD